MPEMFHVYRGELAGVATAALWTVTALFFTAAGKRIGATIVNLTRIMLAILLLAVTHRLLQGSWIPDVNRGQVLFLALSGVIGLAIGDQALFVAFVDIGPRLSTLIMTTSPLVAAFLGWLVLDESLPALSWLGVALTITGVAWVVLERPAARVGAYRWRGITLAFIAAMCQAVGLLLSKQGMGHGWLDETRQIAPQTATLIRMVFAGMGMAPIVALYAVRERKRRAAGLRPQRVGSRSQGFLYSGCGAVAGPFLGVWMSLVAIHYAPLGVAQTLCSLTPIFIVPVVVVIHKERISPRALLGTLLAVGGAVLFFLRPA